MMLAYTNNYFRLRKLDKNFQQRTEGRSPSLGRVKVSLQAHL